MKNVITAIGDKELNEILKEVEGIEIKTADIIYMEGIIEALDKYPDINLVIIKEDIIGNIGIKELIKNIIIAKENIEIVVITERIEAFEGIKQIVKVVGKQKDYVKEITKYLEKENYIKQKNETSIDKPIEKKNEQMVNNEKVEINENTHRKRRYKERSFKTNQKQIITIIGSSGVRQNNIYFSAFKTYFKKENTNH